MESVWTQNMLLCLSLILGITNLVTGDETAMAAVCQVQPNTDPSTVLNENVTGTVVFYQKDDASDNMIYIKLSGFSTTDANTKHGFHVHANGNLEGGCGATGGHYNPNNKVHGAPWNTTRHVGDLGNIEEDAQGNVNVNITDSVAKLFGDQSIIGKAIVVHAGEDDLGLGGHIDSNTTGNAGGRLACCIIQKTTVPTDAASPTGPASILFISVALWTLLRIWT